MSKQPTEAAVKADPAEFRKRLIVECNGEPRRLVDVLDPWQEADFAALDPGWQVVAGVKPKSPPTLRGYLERPRGHSKTSDIALMASWAIYAAPSRIRGVAAAGDADQARLVLNAIDSLCRLNPPIGEVLDVQRGAVVNRRTGSELSVISSDAPTSFGLLPHFVVADELSHWKDAGESLWHSLFSSAAKQAKCLLCIISNAGLGMGTSWQWKVREAARTDADWYFSRLDGPQASWITPKILAEQERLLPSSTFRRYWLNEWLSQAGDLLEAADIEAAIDTTLGPMNGDEPDYLFIAGLDLGIRRDHSALVVLGVDPARGLIRLANCESWKPLPGADVQLDDIEVAVQQAFWQYRLRCCYFDPWNCAGLAQRLIRAGYPVWETPSTPTNLSRFATSLITVFRDRQIKLYREPELIADLGKLQLVETQTGVKASAPRDRSGHCDRASALMLCLPDAFAAITEYQPPLPPMPETVFDL